MSESATLLSVEHVTVRLHGARHATNQIGGTRILNDVSLRVDKGQIVGLIGETGSGKTTLARAIVGLIDPVNGAIRFEGEEISRLKRRDLRSFRRSGKVQFVFQDPLRSLDPDMTVGRIVGEGLAIRGDETPEQQTAAIDYSLESVGLDPSIRARRPGEISGGQRQRVSIARAVVMRPRLLLCDEPVSALDASTRNFVLRILADLRREFSLALLIISHDLASLAGIADRVAVLYHGHIVEEGPLERVFETAQHPYTALLVASAPALARSRSGHTFSPEWFGRAEQDVTSEVRADSVGCPFAARCPWASDVCMSVVPPRVELEPDWFVACHHAPEWRSTIPYRAGDRVEAAT